MAVTEQEFARAEAASAAVRQHGYATAARYDRKADRLVVSLHTGIELTVPVHLLEGLAGADAAALSEIEITPSGLGLHWPALDADIYVPGLLSGEFGSRSWMAAELGAQGGRTRSAAKANAARNNGRKGGRPAKRQAIQS
ncbi:DUF2442 domain-containing protein [Lujinxingia vulgaris]|uniref:DUF2442 domain-containing protein n=1 Tax=Lujinxingia vulgaris TaxID=2600176 RepID=A0A5C6X8E7_9DELT|nr:DUF2442 domain-containing protein [Lujinxingia vulgaris]TXD33388.1 DUF2442 domain-containing protein [Lujinxingia vulgaris]